MKTGIFCFTYIAVVDPQQVMKLRFVAQATVSIYTTHLRLLVTSSVISSLVAVTRRVDCFEMRVCVALKIYVP